MKSKYKEIKDLINSDKRLCDRLRLPLKVYYSQGLAKADTEWLGPVSLDNVSGNGIMFHCDQEMPKGEKINVRLYIEDDMVPVDFDGDIVWVKQKDCLAMPGNGKDGLGFLYGVFLKERDIKGYQRFVSYITDNIINEYLDDHGRIKESDED